MILCLRFHTDGQTGIPNENYTVFILLFISQSPALEIPRHEVLKFCWCIRHKNEADLQGGAQGDNGGKIEFDNSLLHRKEEKYGKKIGFFWCRCARVSRTLYWYSIFLYARNIYVHVAASLFIQKKRHELTPVSCVVFCHFFFMYTVIR